MGVFAALAASMVAAWAHAGLAQDGARAALHVQVTVGGETARVETSGRSVTISGGGAARRVLRLDPVSGTAPSGSPVSPRVSWTTEPDGVRRVLIDF